LDPKARVGGAEAVRSDPKAPTPDLVGIAISATSFSLLALSPPLFIAWAIWNTGEVIHPIDVGAALGPWVCLAASSLALTLLVARLVTRPPSLEIAILWVAIAVGICEVLVFSPAVVAVALGIPAAP
jgi:hypothetical protein